MKYYTHIQSSVKHISNFQLTYYPLWGTDPIPDYIVVADIDIGHRIDWRCLLGCNGDTRQWSLRGSLTVAELGRAGLMPGPTKIKTAGYAQDPKIYLKAKKKELSAWDLNHRPQAYISTKVLSVKWTVYTSFSIKTVLMPSVFALTAVNIKLISLLKRINI